jgi:hypothetical protein
MGVGLYGLAWYTGVSIPKLWSKMEKTHFGLESLALEKAKTSKTIT